MKLRRTKKVCQFLDHPVLTGVWDAICVLRHPLPEQRKVHSACYVAEMYPKLLCLSVHFVSGVGKVYCGSQNCFALPLTTVATPTKKMHNFKQNWHTKCKEQEKRHLSLPQQPVGTARHRMYRVAQKSKPLSLIIIKSY